MIRVADDTVLEPGRGCHHAAVGSDEPRAASSTARRDWPGNGPTDERLLGIADDLQRAAELAAGPGRRVKPRTPAAYDDLCAARTRVMHILSVGAHAVGVAVHQDVGYVEAHPAGPHAAARETQAVPRGKDAMTRIYAFEQLAGRYVGGRFGQRMAGQHYTPPGDTSRLHQALVSWDIQAHRTIAVAPSTPNLHLVTRTQAMIMTASTAILNAAESADRIDVEDYQHRPMNCCTIGSFLALFSSRPLSLNGIHAGQPATGPRPAGRPGVPWRRPCVGCIRARPRRTTSGTTRCHRLPERQADVVRPVRPTGRHACPASGGCVRTRSRRFRSRYEW